MNAISLIVSVATVLGLLVTAWTTGRAALRANKQQKENKSILAMFESRKVDKDAFDQAREIYREGIEEVRRQLTACREDLASEKRERQREQSEIRRLTRRVNLLEAEIRKAGLEIPNGMFDPPD